ncbi:class I adenylate-forming enzyme family protein [Piscinibacter sakaiensis]|uniref:Long-chain-fatty-acid--CoA ligase n=1 Tax=Piscinibacter sakaiensis TaxID=1547922 RepID=A0A0K8P698_PISS1|nr:class I adenylate-forming enzyme family protein [Piscinibacter sakaiensis]GAP38198.1 long-chain-fatty-acid--CoA ligase [Piscinibacter sakaiensis]
MKFHESLIDGARRYPDHVALHWIDRDKRLTYAQAVEQMERVAAGLASLGVQRGDRVGIFAHNGLDYVLAMYGAWRLGAISAHINVQYADTLDYFLNDCTPKVLIYTHDHLATINRHRAACPSVQHYVCFDGRQDGAIDWSELIATPGPAPSVDFDDAEGAHLSYTSGTSGRPKGALIGHEPTHRACRCIAERLGFDHQDVTYGASTLSSSYHLVANLLPGIHAGATVGIATRWDAAKAWDAMERQGSTVLPSNATALAELLEHCRSRGAAPGRLRLAVSGGGPVPPTVKRAFRDELKLPLAESYGQTELGGFVGLGPARLPDEEKLLACGPSLPDRHARIVDPITGQDVPTGEVGDIAVGGGHMLGYWGRPEQTAQVVRQGYLYTGDVGRMDAEGYVYVRGRSSERLMVQGEAWYPRDVEEALMEQQAVASAALIGLPDGAGEDRPVAYVILRDGIAVAEAQLLQAAGQRVKRDLSRLELRCVDRLPLTPTGKISKAELKAEALQAAGGAMHPG